MKTITIYLKERAYDVIVARGIFRDIAAARICGLVPAKEKVAIVSDENVWELYGIPLIDELRSNGVKCFPVVIRPGEDSKDMQTLGRIFDTFANEGLGRDGLIVALGGGVIGDVSGFAAACWMRGVRYVQIPTSLLAMVDSSVGGKTAVDIPAGKNLVGAFHQPSLVIVDPDLLATLPEYEFTGGMAEIIKYGAILSKVLFNNIEATKHDAFSPTLIDVIIDCIRIKAKIVAGDELDRGRRALLNFGHTFGHAIEVKYGYSRYPHGTAVAAGMRIAARFGEAYGVTVPETADRLESLLDFYGLDHKESADGLLEYIKHDKKLAGDSVRLILLSEIGKAEVVEIPLSEAEEQLAELWL